MSRTRILVALLSVGGALPSIAVTQVHPEVALYAGRYLPTADMGSAPNSGFSVTQQDRFPHVRVGGGLGLVAHGGRAYQDVDGATSIAGIVSAGLAFAWGRSPFTLRLDAEDYLFIPHLSAGSWCERNNGGTYTGICGHLSRGAAYANRFQNDVILSAGLAVAAGGH